MKMDKEKLISDMLCTPDGKRALAEAMVQPIRREVQYQSLGSKLLMVEPPPAPVGLTFYMDEDITTNRLIDECRRNIKNAILCLEIGG